MGYNLRMKKKENFRIKKLANFLFETRILKYIPRAGLQFLKGPIKENLAEHTFYTAMVAWVLAKMDGEDEEKAVKMALIHDLTEGRGGDRDLINKIYGGEIDEEKIIGEISKDHELKEFKIKNLIEEFLQEKTLEAKIVKDADVLSEILMEKDCLDLGNQKAKKWLEYSFKRLETKSGRELGKTLIETDSDEWWLKIVERYTGYKVSLK
jgi:putative hydrolase of HD superfamily